MAADETYVRNQLYLINLNDLQPDPNQPRKTLNRLPQEIRDDCRGDRNISKNTLIDIAKKTQSRSMIKAYEAYKDKLKKQAEPQQKAQAGTASLSQPVLDLMIKAKDRIRNLATAAWTPEERAGLKAVLGELKDVIDVFLAEPEPTVAEPKTKKKKQPM